MRVRVPAEVVALVAIFLAAVAVQFGTAAYANAYADGTARHELAHVSLAPAVVRDRIIPSGHYYACATRADGYVTEWCWR